MPTEKLTEAEPHVLRVAMGMLAGIVATVAKYWSHDHAHISAILKREHDEIMILLGGYGIGLAVCMFLGAISSLLSRETDFRKMFWIGLSAPALFAAAIPAQPVDDGKVYDRPAKPAISRTLKKSELEFFSPISSAYAANETENCVGDSAFVKGMKTFFGVPNPRPDKWTVVAGSFATLKVAQEKAKKINEEDATLKARVGIRSCSSNYFPVVLGEPSSRIDAERLLEKTENKESVPDDAFISPGPR